MKAHPHRIPPSLRTNCASGLRLFLALQYLAHTLCGQAPEPLTATSGSVPTAGSIADTTRMEPELPETQSTSTQTLEDLWRLAESRHPALAEARHLADATASEGRQAGRLPNPELVVITEGAAGQPASSRRADYFSGFSQSLPLGARLSRARSLAVRETEAAWLQAGMRLWEIRREVHQAYARAWFAQEDLAVQQALARDAAALARIAQSRFQAGDISDLEWSQAKLAEQTAQATARTAQLSLDQAWRALVRSVGQTTLDPRALYLPDPVFHDFEESDIEHRIESHPLLRATLAGVSTAQARKRWVQSLQYPDMQVEALYRREGTVRADSIDVGIRLPLPLWQNQKGKIAAAEARVQAAQAQVDQVRTEVQWILTSAQERLTRWRSEWQIHRSAVLPEARSITRHLETRLEAGDMRLSESIWLRRDLAETLQRQIQIRQELELAIADLVWQQDLPPKPNEPQRTEGTQKKSGH